MMGNTGHSPFSPSGLGDKILCPAKHQLTKDLPNTSSPAAERGTECHDWAEKLILMGDWFDRLPPANFSEDWQEKCTKDMVGQVVDFIDLWSLEGGYRLALEEKADLSWLNVFKGRSDFDFSEVWGTADVVILQPEAGRLAILDYKTGMLPVDPKNNTQLKVYALGCLRHRWLEEPYGQIKEVTVGVAQPRVYDSLQTWTISVEDLTNWALKDLLPALELMTSENPPFATGKKQCRWCSANGGHCSAKKEEMLSLLDSVPESKTENGKLGMEELGELAPRLGEFKAWVKKLEEGISSRLLNGEKTEALKLVRGRAGNRRYLTTKEGGKPVEDRKKVANFFRSVCGLKKDDFMIEKIKSPAQMEKLVKPHLNSTRRKNSWKKLVEKPEGKITWALRGDKREEVIQEDPLDMLDLEVSPENVTEPEVAPKTGATQTMEDLI